MKAHLEEPFTPEVKLLRFLLPPWIGGGDGVF